MFGISRIDYGYTQCWYVRLFYGTSDYITCSFSDKKYKGKLKAKLAAILWRDATVKEYQPKGNYKTRHNKDKGVVYSERYRKDRPRPEMLWTASVYDKTIHKCRTKTYSVGNIRSYNQGEKLAWEWKHATLKLVKNNVSQFANEDL